MVLLCVASLGGCSVWPIEKKYDRAELAKGAAMPAAVSVDDAKKIAQGWSDQLQEATRDRVVQGIVAKEVLFYGTLLLTAGAVQLSRGASDGWRRVRNVGAGAAAGSELFSSHYQTADQAMAFQKASAQMTCMIESLQPIPDRAEYLALFDDDEKARVNAGLTADPKDLDALYNAVPRQTLHFMEQTVLPNLQAELKSVRLGTPSKEELTTLVDKYKTAKDSGTAGANNVGTPDNAAVNNVHGLLSRNGIVAQPSAEVIKLRRKEVVAALAAYSSAIALCRPT
ncbi:hypothetical protein [Roseateles chitosanitabidus]|uniref:hypothetical protein n=1 Tax=Roseateles chitosanitabidus TaxID=65048 RepID=UPI00082C87A7|nr:hypothetical protein [Roseateles chitosanitabidus]